MRWLLALALATATTAATPAIHEETGMVGVPRAQLHYRLWRLGEGPDRARRPLIVYLHGGPGANGAVFRQAVGPMLARRAGDVLFIDQRGAGRSPEAGLKREDFTLDRFADDARRVIEWVRARHPELPRPLVIGHSFGGAIAVLLARRAPALIAKLMLLSPALDFRDVKYHAYLAMRQRAEREGDRAHLDRIRQLEALHPPGSPGEGELFAAALTGSRFGFAARRFAGAEEADLHRILAAREAEPMRVAEHWAHFQAADRLDRRDLTPELPGLKLPVLVYGGREDYLTPPATLEKASALIPGARLVLVPGAGHHPYLLDPEAFVTAVAALTR
jgi:proline iminopeptidase